MGRAKSGSGVLVGVLVLGMLGFVAAQQLGPLTPALESFLSAPLGGSSDTTEPVADVSPETAGGGIPARPSEAVSMTVPS